MVIDGIPGIDFGSRFKTDPEVAHQVNELVSQLRLAGKDVPPFRTAVFEDPNLFNALKDSVNGSAAELGAYLENSIRFEDVINKERQYRRDGKMDGLFGKEVHMAESEHADGKVRRSESGYRINVDYLRSLGVDPARVLYFRVTQLSETPKPEFYWTSDYRETQHGLTAEISPEQRKTAVIIVASLEAINQNGGLIQDINDDQGLAVRQIGLEGFDQKQAITKIKSE